MSIKSTVNKSFLDKMGQKDYSAMLSVNPTNQTDYDIGKIQSVIDKYSGGKSPVNAEMIVESSKRTGTPVDMYLVMGASESHFGTKGRAVGTKNIYNVGNTDGGDGNSANDPRFAKYNNFQKDWAVGLDTFGNLISKQYFPDNNPDLDAFIANDFRRPDGARYMTSSAAKDNIVSLRSRIRGMLA